jgi:hypothetical protein
LAIEYLEWTGANHLRHSKFAGLSENSAFRASQGCVRKLIKQFDGKDDAGSCFDSVRELERGWRFYDAALRPLGIVRTLDFEYRGDLSLLNLSGTGSGCGCFRLHTALDDLAQLSGP